MTLSLWDCSALWGWVWKWVSCSGFGGVIMLSGRLTFELFVFLTSKGILCFTKKVFFFVFLFYGINTLEAQREVRIRLVDMVEKLVSFLCSVYLDNSWFFNFFKMGSSSLSICCFLYPYNYFSYAKLELVKGCFIFMVWLFLWFSNTSNSVNFTHEKSRGTCFQ